jgi:hypothetical protein
MFWSIRVIELLIYICTFVGTVLAFRELGRENTNKKFVWYTIACFALTNFALFLWVIS